MMFGQLCNRESLRDLTNAVAAHQKKCYHLGFGKHVSKTNLAYANSNRDYRIFEEYAYYLIAEARKKRATDIFQLGGNIYAFDSTAIDLCLSDFWWAKFRKHKGGIKVHTLYDVETQVPAFFHRIEEIGSFLSSERRKTCSIEQSNGNEDCLIWNIADFGHIADGYNSVTRTPE